MVIRRRHRLVRLATALVLAQAGASALTGLPFARGRTDTVLGALALSLALLVIAAVLSTGTPTARNVVLVLETAAFLFGAGVFISGGRWVGGTIFAGVVVVTLAHPAVAAAFGVSERVSARRRPPRGPIPHRRASPPRTGRYDRGDGRHPPPRD